MVLLKCMSMVLIRLFGEAWARQRRRHRSIAWSLVGLLAVALLLRLTSGGAQSGGTIAPRTPIPVVSAGTVLARAPYLGVRCPSPNSITCDRVGLAVWLRRPALHVSGTIAGQPLVLDWFGDERRVGSLPPRRELDGYLHPARIVTRLGVHPDARGQWFGSPTGPWPTPIVRLTITFANGRRVVTRLRVPLRTGWG
jgi:GNAT superfamily N-acetyltransferase